MMSWETGRPRGMMGALVCRLQCGLVRNLEHEEHSENSLPMHLCGMISELITQHQVAVK